jgi:hypothetical protein
MKMSKGPGGSPVLVPPGGAWLPPVVFGLAPCGGGGGGGAPSMAVCAREGERECYSRRCRGRGGDRSTDSGSVRPSGDSSDVGGDA